MMTMGNKGSAVSWKMRKYQIQKKNQLEYK